VGTGHGSKKKNTEEKIDTSNSVLCSMGYDDRFGGGRDDMVPTDTSAFHKAKAGVYTWKYT
jgi:hypothetical protein